MNYVIVNYPTLRKKWTKRGRSTQMQNSGVKGLGSRDGQNSTSGGKGVRSNLSQGEKGIAFNDTDNFNSKKE